MKRAVEVYAAIAVWASCAAVAPTNANGQATAGLLISVSVVSQTGESVAAAFVRVIDDKGQSIARGIADGAGVATMRVPKPGQYRISVDRIGYDSWTSKEMELQPNSAAIEIRIPVNAIRVDSVAVSSKNRCAVSAGVGASVAGAATGAARLVGRLLGIGSKPLISSETAITLLPRIHARTMAALRLASDHAAVDSSYDVRIISERPRYVGRKRAATSVDTTTRNGIEIQNQPAERLAVEGFIRPRAASEDEPTYYLPTPEVIISEVFALSHCFKVVAHPDSGWVGLRFDPFPSETGSDVRGIIWTDTVKGQVIRIDFNYTRLAEFLEAHELRFALQAASTKSIGTFREARARQENADPNAIKCQYWPRREAPNPNEDEFGGSIEFGFLEPHRWTVIRAELRWPILQGAAADDGIERRSGGTRCNVVSYTHIITFNTEWTILARNR